MTISDWINLIAAILVGGGTFFLGIMAWRTIRQTRGIQKAEKRERLLNEIIEWALDIAESALHRKTIQQLEEFRTTKMEYELSRAESRYIGEIVSRFFDDLSPSLKNVITKLDEAIDIITRKIEKSQGSLKDLRNSEKDLTESVEKLIVEIAKIKTKNIGKKEENMSNEEKTAGDNEPTLKDIEEHLKRQDRRTKWQWLFSVGVSAMAVGLTWVIATMSTTPGDFWTGLFVFFLGVVIALLSLFYRHRKKS